MLEKAREIVELGHAGDQLAQISSRPGASGDLSFCHISV